MDGECFALCHNEPQLLLNPNTLGLMCYAYGLRDKGFDVLNTLGCTCSNDHLRNRGAFWAKKPT